MRERDREKRGIKQIVAGTDAEYHGEYDGAEYRVHTFLSRVTVMVDGTMLPCEMKLSIVLPSSDPDFLSARRQSPADKWQNPSFWDSTARLDNVRKNAH